jgi:hypothetical protein
MAVYVNLVVQSLAPGVVLSEAQRRQLSHWHTGTLQWGTTRCGAHAMLCPMPRPCQCQCQCRLWCTGGEKNQGVLWRRSKFHCSTRIFDLHRPQAPGNLGHMLTRRRTVMVGYHL